MATRSHLDREIDAVPTATGCVEGLANGGHR